MKQLGLDINTNSTKTTPSLLLKEMKQLNESNWASNSTQSSISYIFTKQVVPKSLKESRLQSFLTSEGIFQINLGMVFEEYSFSSFVPHSN